MKILKTVQEFKDWRKALSVETSVGFVATMGALHSGHAELLKKSKAENQISVLSIFVNPAQFNDPNDFAKYPKTWEADLAIAEKNQVDAIFAPEAQSMYPDDFKYKLSESEFSLDLCGAHRPGHFDGVLTVVMKLFQIIKPQRAYFGEKDFQQLTLIQNMVSAFFMDTEIIPVATLREPDGLALSSRNVRLTSEERSRAPFIYQTISQSASADQAAQELTQAGFDVEYVKDIKQRRFVAVKLGAVRLIDNVKI